MIKNIDSWHNNSGKRGGTKMVTNLNNIDYSNRLPRGAKYARKRSRKIY